MVIKRLRRPQEGICVKFLKLTLAQSNAPFLRLSGRAPRAVSTRADGGLPDSDIRVGYVRAAPNSHIAVTPQTISYFLLPRGIVGKKKGIRTFLFPWLRERIG